MNMKENYSMIVSFNGLDFNYHTMKQHMIEYFYLYLNVNKTRQIGSDRCKRNNKCLETRD